MFALVLVLFAVGSGDGPHHAGFDDVRLLANDGRFWRLVGNTFVFLSIHVPLQIVTPLALALALNRQLVLRSFWRAAFRPRRSNTRVSARLRLRRQIAGLGHDRDNESESAGGNSGG